MKLYFVLGIILVVIGLVLIATGIGFMITPGLMSYGLTTVSTSVITVGSGIVAIAYSVD